MLLKIGGPPEHGFDQPLGLLSDCHRRIEHFLFVLSTIAALFVLAFGPYVLVRMELNPLWRGRL